MKNFVEELRWRGMIHDMMPGTEELIKQGMTTAYIGFDPSSDSLHIGSLVQIMMLRHFQECGHKPLVLIGGATGMIGDPSEKAQERQLLDEETLLRNQRAIKAQLSRFLDFNPDRPNAAEMVNNYEWMKEFSFLGFIRDIGKHITVNYMMSKDSVKKRLSQDSRTGMSFTEFSYQLVQGTDFLHLYRQKNCRLQMGGSDQWGNIVTGTELIRRKLGGEAYALTSPLITKSDGGKFGKTEEGNIWLDPSKTSPYKFYQYWLNTSDEDAGRYIRIFTMLSKERIEKLIAMHEEKPHERILQKELAREVTMMVHSLEDYEAAAEASQILFGAGTTESLKRMDENTFLSVFEGVPVYDIKKHDLHAGIALIDLLSVHSKIFASKSEARRLVDGGGLSINKEKVDNQNLVVDGKFLLNDKYILVQKGRKNYYLIRCID